MNNSTTRSNKIQAKAPLYDEIKSISNFIETIFDIKLTEKDFKEGRKEILHIYLYKACHAAIAHCVPWMHDLPEVEQTALDEIMTRLLEMEIGSSLDLFVHSDQAFLDELSRYPVGLNRAVFEHFQGVWQAYFWPKRDPGGMAAYLLTVLRHGRVVYHILPQDDWQIAREIGIYTPSSLAVEGFIHCSEIDQVLGSAQTYFAGQRDLYLLCIALQKVTHEVRYENATGGEGKGFPHIYGPLTLEAVVGVSALELNADGDFLLPQYPQALVENEGKA